MSESIFNPVFLLDLPWSEKRQLLLSQGLPNTLILGLHGTVNTLLEQVDFARPFPQKVYGPIPVSCVVFDCGCIFVGIIPLRCTMHAGNMICLLNSK